MSTPSGKFRSFNGKIVAAFATFVYLYLLFPTLIIVPMSFGNRMDMEFPPVRYSLDLYRDYLHSSDWLAVTGRSALYASLTAILAMIVGVPAGYALSRTQFPGKRLVVLLTLSPMMVPAIVISLGLYLYYLKLNLTGTAFGIVLAHAMFVMPYIILTISAGVENLDERLERAAVIMGAGQLHVFRTVVLPQLGSSLVSAGIFAFLMSFDEVVIAWFITGPDTMTLPVKMYSSIKWEASPVLAAVATILTGLSVVVCVVTSLLKNAPANPVDSSHESKDDLLAVQGR
ncbi:ABC transporter permease [Burkholderia sola]|uniref:ABC transporter permease n=1 Tax=Burkholderia sola TaxID=2843302 RepID=UPI0023DD948D|nr:ABC transporter permease [Burkholderia sola]MDF3084387.1 ABC transporter permease [Burkholderia sola]